MLLHEKVVGEMEGVPQLPLDETKLEAGGEADPEPSRTTLTGLGWHVPPDPDSLLRMKKILVRLREGVVALLLHLLSSVYVALPPLMLNVPRWIPVEMLLDETAKEKVPSPFASSVAAVVLERGPLGIDMETVWEGGEGQKLYGI